jgi:hypothetical protein
VQKQGQRQKQIPIRLRSGQALRDDNKKQATTPAPQLQSQTQLLNCNRHNCSRNATVNSQATASRSAAEEGFYAVEVFFGVDTDGVEGGGLDVDVDSVFEEAELFEALGLFEGAGGQGWELVER